VSARFESTLLSAPAQPDWSPRLTAAPGFDPALVEACSAHDAGERNLERLAAGGALCVTTGQQPGLLTGPVFTIYKALTAVALARAAERALVRPVVPVFWVAGDDHDFQEANHLELLTPANEIERVVLRERTPEAPSLPLYREPLGNEITAALETVERGTPDTEFRASVMAWLARHYRADADFAQAFAGAMAELLGPSGLVVFRSTHPAAKRAMAPLLLRLLDGAQELDGSLTARAAALRQAGQDVPVTVGDGATPVMLEDAQGRDRLLLEADGFRTRRAGAHWTLEALRGVAQREPERLSPNVLARPALEAALLPTLTYVAGPGELGYLPQAAPVYELLEVEPQTALPRWSGCVIESRVAKVLDKFAITSQDLAAPQGKLEADLVRDDMPDAARAALESLGSSLGGEYERLERAAREVDPTLEKPVRSARNNALKELGGVEKRIVGHLKKRNEIVIRQLDKARRSLFPHGKPQERVFNVVQFLVRYGPAFIDDALEAAAAAVPPLDTSHRGA
jgi:bacillithiol biosynthesis cysteine-adding enzyme BshC